MINWWKSLIKISRTIQWKGAEYLCFIKVQVYDAARAVCAVNSVGPMRVCALSRLVLIGDGACHA